VSRGRRRQTEAGGVIEVEEFELAFARLQWVRTSSCLHLPAQHDALQWHIASCDAALAALKDLSLDGAAS
jgi:hypothetical protein